MKLGTKLSIVIITVSLINAVVTVLATTPDVKPAVSAAAIVAVHAATLFAAIISVHFIVTKPLRSLRENVKSYKSGNRFRAVERGDEIGELYNSFSDLTGQIDAEKAAQNRIIASISHDIKTPLTSVMGYTEFLKNPNLTEARREKYINTIYEKAKDIQDTVLGFDDYLSHNLDLNLKCEFMTAGELLDRAAEHMSTDALGSGVRDRAAEHMSTDALGSGVRVVRDYEACRDEQIYVDRQRLGRVFMNTVTNAVKHSGKDPVTVTLSAEKRDGGILIKITDDGIGVKKDQLEKIFEPLYTTDNSRSVAGLGLSICREIVGSHGGTIHAESEYGKFFSVCFTLPTVSGRKKPV